MILEDGVAGVPITTIYKVSTARDRLYVGGALVRAIVNAEPGTGDSIGYLVGYLQYREGERDCTTKDQYAIPMSSVLGYEFPQKQEKQVA